MDCARRVEAIDDQLAVIEGLVRLYCGRAVLGDEGLDASADQPLGAAIDLIDAEDDVAANVLS